MTFFHRFNKVITGLILFLFLVCSTIPVFAGASSYSSGGRSSYSSSTKSLSNSSSKAPSSSSYSSSTKDTKANKSSAKSPSSVTSSGGRSSFSTSAKSFSTPRESTPESLTRNYQTGQKSFSGSGKSYTTKKRSFSGTWDKEDDNNNETDDRPVTNQSGQYTNRYSPPAYQENPTYYGSPRRYGFIGGGSRIATTNYNTAGTGTSATNNNTASSISGWTILICVIIIPGIAIATLYYIFKRRL